MKEEALEEDKPKGLTGTLYGITVLPENMDEWIEEIYKRKVPIEEAKEVAEYLLTQQRQKTKIEGRIKVYQYLLDRREAGKSLSKEVIKHRLKYYQRKLNATPNKDKK